MRQKPFQIVNEYAPAGDQPKAIAGLVEGVRDGYLSQTLLGVTGSGKTYTMASVIAELQRPALILCHNKTLAAQLYNEMKGVFPHNAVEYFISYYDYYQPEAYIPRTDTFIEKTAQINDDIDRMRHSATRNLFERRDVVVVSSVSCIYGLGLPENYLEMAIRLQRDQTISRKVLLRQLVRNQYQRSDIELKRATFRVRGDVIDVIPAYADTIIFRIELFGDTVENLTVWDKESNTLQETLEELVLYPAVHYVQKDEEIDGACARIEAELNEQLQYFSVMGKHLEAQRLEQRTRRDLAMIRELGYCNGIENYSRILENRAPGSPPRCLVDYFPQDFLLFIDESHVTIPQLRGMYHGDRSRKDTLVDYGFRLPAARDNRPLNFEEFLERIGQRVYVSATPAAFELEQSQQVVEMIIRPTGLLDPEITVFPTAEQVDHLHDAILGRVERNERVLITTLTKRMAEDLSEFFQARNVRVRYLHSDIKPLERIEIIRDLRLGQFDVLIGVNLLREGLDLPEVSLVAIMDADKEGFLRSESSLIQTIGRAARNACGEVYLYADKITDSMQRAMDETARRRTLQIADNAAKGIIPTTIVKPISNSLLEFLGLDPEKADPALKQLTEDAQKRPAEELPGLIEQLEQQMREAAKLLQFEQAAQLRDQIHALKNLLLPTNVE